MKFAIITISFLSLLISCNPTAKPAQEQPNELIEKLKPFLNGIWVPKNYVNAIVKTKSPLKSSDQLTFISEFVIDTTDISADSLHVGMALGNHEGSDCIIYFKQGQYPNSLLTSIIGFENEPDSYELGYLINNIDTSLVLYHFDKNKKLLDTTKYIKVLYPVRPYQSLEDGFQYIVNQKLVTGSYTVTDSTGDEKSIVLTSDGTIKGFPGYKTYYILTDFVAGPENATDKICFDIQTGNQQCYGFKIDEDTIKLFSIPDNETDTLFEPGPPVYRFIKRN